MPWQNQQTHHYRSVCSVPRRSCAIQSAKERKTLVVEDVHQFPGHIACDGASNSEIVVPIIKNGELLGVLDIDSPNFSRFNLTDQYYLELVIYI